MLAEAVVVAWFFTIAVPGGVEKVGPYPTRIECENERNDLAFKLAFQRVYVGECYAEHYQIRKPF